MMLSVAPTAALAVDPIAIPNTGLFSEAVYYVTPNLANATEPPTTLPSVTPVTIEPVQIAPGGLVTVPATNVAPTRDELLKGLDGDYWNIWFGQNTKKENSPDWESGDVQLAANHWTRSVHSWNDPSTTTTEDGTFSVSGFDAEQWLRLQLNTPDSELGWAAVSHDMLFGVGRAAKPSNGYWGSVLLVRKPSTLTASAVAGPYAWFQLDVLSSGTGAYLATGTTALSVGSAGSLPVLVAQPSLSSTVGQTLTTSELPVITAPSTATSTASDLGTFSGARPASDSTNAAQTTGNWSLNGKKLVFGNDTASAWDIGEGGLAMAAFQSNTAHGPAQSLVLAVKKGVNRKITEAAGDYLIQGYGVNAHGAPGSGWGTLHIDPNGVWRAEINDGNVATGIAEIDSDGTLHFLEQSDDTPINGVLSLDGKQIVLSFADSDGTTVLAVAIQRPVSPTAPSVEHTVQTIIEKETVAETNLTSKALALGLLNDVQQVWQAGQRQGDSGQAIADAVNLKIEQVFGPQRRQQLLDAGFDYHQYVVLWGTPEAVDFMTQDAFPAGSDSTHGFLIPNGQVIAVGQATKVVDTTAKLAVAIVPVRGANWLVYSGQAHLDPTDLPTVTYTSQAPFVANDAAGAVLFGEGAQTASVTRMGPLNKHYNWGGDFTAKLRGIAPKTPDRQTLDLQQAVLDAVRKQYGVQPNGASLLVLWFDPLDFELRFADRSGTRVSTHVAEQSYDTSNSIYHDGRYSELLVIQQPTLGMYSLALFGVNEDFRGGIAVLVGSHLQDYRSAAFQGHFQNLGSGFANLVLLFNAGSTTARPIVSAPVASAPPSNLAQLNRVSQAAVFATTLLLTEASKSAVLLTGGQAESPSWAKLIKQLWEWFDSLSKEPAERRFTAPKGRTKPRAKEPPALPNRESNDATAPPPTERGSRNPESATNGQYARSEAESSQ